MNIKERFLKLVEYTTPYGNEHELVKYLPKGLTKDTIGNYYIKVGDSRTLFVTHLDNVTRKKEKVNIIIEGDIIKTDEKTILGADNKAGVCVLSHMIEKNIPGLYYFFVGEEPTAPNGGLVGSKGALKLYKEQFKNYDRCIAFDRKAYGSIISRQMATNCCSNEFINELIKEFSQFGLEHKKDSTGYWTDSAVFMWDISECTNISIGTFNEHSKKEYQDMSYLYKMCDTVLKIKWDELPVVRNISNKPNYKEQVIKNSISNFSTFSKFKNKEYVKIFNKVYNLLAGYNCVNEENFGVGVNMIFSSWFNDELENIKIVIDSDENIWFNGDKIGGFKVFKKFMIDKFKINILEDLDDVELYNNIVRYYQKNYDEKKHYDLKNERYILSFVELEDILTEMSIDIEDFIEYKDKFDNTDVFNFIEYDDKLNVFYVYDEE